MSGISSSGTYSDAQRSVVGPDFSHLVVIALMADVQLAVSGLAISGARWTPGVNGRVLGFSRDQDAAISAGTLTVKLFKNGSSAGTVALTTGQRGHSNFASAISFTSTDSLDFRISTDAAIAGATKLVVIPRVVFDS